MKKNVSSKFENQFRGNTDNENSCMYKYKSIQPRGIYSSCSHALAELSWRVPGRLYVKTQVPVQLDRHLQTTNLSE